jgi:SpoVK/Ycf46/Vps4 family AAA+-type ATPase
VSLVFPHAKLSSHTEPDARAQVEIGLPDEAGRNQILAIHTEKMETNSFLDRSVDVATLSALTKNFSGAEIEGLVKSAVSFALHRQVTQRGPTPPASRYACSPAFTTGCPSRCTAR